MNDTFRKEKIDTAKIEMTATNGNLVDVNPIHFFASVALMLDLEKESQLYHAWRVAVVAYHLATRLTPFQAPHIFLASLLADCGAIRCKRHIVHELIDSPATLSQKSQTDLFFHPVVGSETIKPIPGMRKVARLILQHHECFNGSGYPASLDGENIELGAQIIRIADQFDLIMRADQPERAEDIINSLATFAGEEFSKPLLKALSDLLVSELSLAKLIQHEKIANEVDKICGSLSQFNLFNSNQEWERAFEAIGDMIDYRNDLFSRGHSHRVASLSGKIAQQMGLSEEDQKLTRWAAYLQNMGEVGLRRQLLAKSGKLDEAEKQLIKYHPILGYNLISRISGFADLAKIIRHHHESWDGSGYPEGLAMTETPIQARILHLADSFDAMTSDRSYQRKREWKIALKELYRKSGKQYDPQVVEAARTILSV